MLKYIAVTIPQTQLRELLAQYRRQNWAGIQTPDWQERIVADMLRSEAPAVLERIAPYWQPGPGARILDLGSGAGGFVAACRKRGLSAYGVEPDRIGNGAEITAIQIAAQRVVTPAFVVGVGERLPFADCAFDLVVLDQVLEHVSDQSSVLAEALRVVKPNGAVFIACPNYLCFYEPHYKVAFLPLMPKVLGKWYLKLRGRNPILLEQIQYTTNWRVRSLLRQFSLQIIFDLNADAFLSKCAAGGFVSRKAKRIRRLTQVPLLGGMLRRGMVFLIRLRERGTAMLISPEGFSRDSVASPELEASQVA